MPAVSTLDLDQWLKEAQTAVTDRSRTLAITRLIAVIGVLKEAQREVERLALLCAHTEELSHEYAALADKRLHELEEVQRERDKAHDVIEAARAYRLAESGSAPRIWRRKALHDLGVTLDNAIERHAARGGTKPTTSANPQP